MPRAGCPHQRDKHCAQLLSRKLKIITALFSCDSEEPPAHHPRVLLILVLSHREHCQHLKAEHPQQSIPSTLSLRMAHAGCVLKMRCSGPISELSTSQSQQWCAVTQHSAGGAESLPCAGCSQPSQWEVWALRARYGTAHPGPGDGSAEPCWGPGVRAGCSP